MKPPQDPRFKQCLLMAYGAFWGGESLVMLTTFLTNQVFKTHLHSKDLDMYIMGPVFLIMFVGAVLLLIGNCYLNLTSNKILNRILGLLSFIIQAGVNFALFILIWVFFLLYVLDITIC